MIYFPFGSHKIKNMEAHNTYKQVVHINARTGHLHDVMPPLCP